MKKWVRENYTIEKMFYGEQLKKGREKGKEKGN